MKAMTYYYLDGLEKKGPYTLSEMLSRNLNPETMIFREDKSNWYKLSDLEELNVTEVEPEIDLAENDFIKTTKENNKNPDLTEERKIKLPNYVYLILMILISIGSSFLILNNQKRNDLGKINIKIDDVFKGKVVISDYLCSREIHGKLYDVVLNPNITFLGEENPYISENDHIIIWKPRKDPNDKDDYPYEKNLEQWNLFKNLNQYYETYFGEDFEVLKLTKRSDDFTITTYFSGDMAYKVPETIYHNGFSSEYFSSPGYEIPTYRPSVKKCYEEAAKFLTVEDEDKSYVDNSYCKY